MLRLWDLCYDFKDTVHVKALWKEDCDTIDGLRVCTETIDTISDRFVYVGLPADADRLLDIWDKKTCFNLIITDCDHQETYHKKRYLNLVVSSLPFAELLNHLMSSIDLYRTWQNQLEAVPVGKGGLNQLLLTAVSILDSKVNLFLLSPSFRIIESCVLDNSLSEKINFRLADGGYLVDYQANFFLEHIMSDLAVTYRMESIQERDSVLGYLVTVTDVGIKVPEGFIRLLLHFLEIQLTGAQDFSPMEESALKKLLSDIMSFTSKDESLILQRLNHLPYKLDRYIRFVLISADSNSKSSQRNLIVELERVFSNSNIAPYDKYIVILLPEPDLLHRYEFNERAFNVLLKKYDAYAVISRMARQVRGLRTVYEQSKEMSELLLPMDITKGNRFTFFEDINDFYRVYLCASCIRDHYGHDSLIYLTHPIVGKIMKYDRANNSQLLEVLSTYLDNDCNVVKTSETMHFHRNTITNKLNKICDYFGIDLSDSKLRTDLQFSCQLARYAMHINRSGVQESGFLIGDK